MFRRFFIPIEVYDRGFDAKLLIALRLLAEKGFHTEVIFGFDKNITSIIRKTNLNGVLLDKSCSDIMYYSRIEPLLNKGGRVCVGDEEGVNNLKDNFKTLSTRFAPESVKGIHRFMAWGKLDQQLALSVGIDSSKIDIVGNPRLDLLGDQGKSFYSEMANALQTVYGPFILFNDNFAIEHFNPNYISPQRNFLSKDEKIELENVRTSIKEAARKDRKQVTSWIEKSSKINPQLNYIVRPHPVSDPSYWLTAFSKLRNVHVIYKHSVEPWLMAASSVISCGCTTALQAAIADIPVYHFPSIRDKISKSIAASLGSLVDINHPSLPDTSQEDKNNSYNIVSQYINTSPNCSVRVAKILSSESQLMTHNSPLNQNSMIQIKSALPNLNPIEPKWRESNISLRQIQDKLVRFTKSFSIDSSTLRTNKLMNSVFCFSNEN